MSDLSEYMPETPLTHPKLIAMMCADCIPTIERSDWPSDAINLPSKPGHPWPGDTVVVVNIMHGESCPMFRRLIAAGEAPHGMRFAAMPEIEGFESVLFRETLDLLPPDVPPLDQGGGEAP